MAEEVLETGAVGDVAIKNIGVTVSDSGETILIASQEISKLSGFFAVKNGGANTIRVFPRVSVDGVEFFELDNGSGNDQTAGNKNIYSWISRYRFVELVATAVVTTNDVDAYFYAGRIGA